MHRLEELMPWRKLSRRRIVERGLLEGSIPMYGVAGAAAAPVLADQLRQGQDR
jgi:hypothetical protein